MGMRTGAGLTQVAEADPVFLIDPATGLPSSVAAGSTAVKATAAAPTYVEGSTTNPLSADLSGALRVTGSFSASTVSKANASDPTFVEGSTANPLSSDLSGYLRMGAKQLGAWSITNISGTISLPTGAATSAIQSSVIGSKAPGTAAANAVLTGGVYSSTPPTLTNGQQAAFQMDAAGALKVSGAGGGQQYAEDAAHASGDLGTMALAVRKDTAAALAGTDGDYQPLIADASGRLHVSMSGVDFTSGTAGAPAGGVSSVQGFGYDVAATITRPANATAYAARDVVGGAITFTALAPAAASILITGAQLEIDVAAIPSGMTSFRLYLYSVTPPSAVADNGAFDLASGDRASYLGVIDLGTPVDEGSTLYVETASMTKQIKTASANVFGYLVTVGAYTPAANSEVYKVTLHAVGV